MGNSVKKTDRPTREAFVKWLQISALPNLEQLSEWPKGVTKDDYFWSEAVWPSRVIVKAEVFSQEFRAHKAGDGTAIFRYAQQNREALRRNWVIRQLISWRLENTPESERLFKKFVRAYWSRQGNRQIINMVQIIKRDIEIYSASLSHPRGTRTAYLANRFGLSSSGIKAVLIHYNKAYERWAESNDAYLWVSTNLPVSPS
jgi:hypothetical protein